MTTKRKRSLQAKRRNWIELTTKKKPKCAVPVLPRFQADLSNFAGNCQDSDSSKWLGKRIWPLPGSCNDLTEDKIQKKEVNGEESQSCTCTCQSPGSVECVKLHIAEERNRLKTELGPAFEEWEFDQMGEEALTGWSQTEENMFEEMMKRKQFGNQEILVQPYQKCFMNKDRKNLVSYLFNVYIPRKFSRETRGSCTDVCTDDDNDDDDKDNSQNLIPEKPEPSYNSQKRATSSESLKKEDSKSEKAVEERRQDSSKSKTKNKYLAGFR